MTQTIGRALVSHGHHVSVVGIYNQEKSRLEDDRGVQVYRLAASRIPKTGYFVNGWRIRQSLQHIAREIPIDILDGPELGFAMIPKSFPATKIIRMNGGHHFFRITLGNKPEPWRSWLEKRSFKSADHFCAVSQFAGETTRKLLKLGEIPVRILPNPVDTRLFSPQPDVSEEYGLIIFSGTVCEKKGIRQLVDAFPEISSAVPEARLWVNGKDSIEPKSGRSYIEFLKRRIPAHLADRIHFNGHVALSELPGMYAKGSVLAFPSHMETQGIVVIEGMAMGKVVVASQTGPGTELIEHCVSGYLCDPHEPASIAQAIIRTLQNPLQRSLIGKAARERVLNLFSIDALIKPNIDFYESCLNENSN